MENIKKRKATTESQELFENIKEMKEIIKLLNLEIIELEDCLEILNNS
tara:strand:+ start:215 stop:358 length:144 start_codon:yes stop_codon:yes gene_type:complete